jgi:hypothetical protein
MEPWFKAVSESQTGFYVTASISVLRATLKERTVTQNQEGAERLCHTMIQFCLKTTEAHKCEVFAEVR